MLMLGITGIFAGIFLSLTAVGVFTNEERGISKSLVVLDAFSNAPSSMQEELDPSFNDRVLNPMLSRFTSLGKRLTPHDYAERIQHKLDVAGNPVGWNVDRIVSLKVIGIGGGAFVGMLLALLLGAGPVKILGVIVVGAVLGYFGPNYYIYQKGYDRTQQMQRDLPDALDLLSISVEAGLGFDAALAQVARNTTGPLAHELARVLQEMQIGLGRASALRALGERSSLADLRSFTSAMVQADAFGIPMSKVLRVQSDEIRLKRRQRAEEKAQQVPVKMMIPLVLFILPTLFIAVLGPAVIGMLGAFSSGGAMN
ncbi:type II secretion system F family protein [Nocardioides panacis]|uniref:Type II secretion system F family protein n=2 Tax=Nocardioides panacis TaxID=2849501 RepID=A0A975XYH5_9ACTN|nr:type II secretion system F family protein [Nocardioides panacis]